MAGGAKETPRQRMIGMMYLVLTALLALQVSNAVLEKFIFIDESLRYSVQVSKDATDQLLKGVQAQIEKDGNKPKDVAIMAKAQKAKDESRKMLGEIENLREELVKYTGGRDKETGELVDGKNYDKSMTFLIGTETGAKGKAYELKEKLNAFAASMSKYDKDIAVGPLAQDAKDIPMFAKNNDQKTKDFARLNFENTPLVATLAVLSEMQTKVARAESQVINEIAKEIGGVEIKFDKVEAMATAESRVVAAGTKYKAKMFLGASVSNVTPKMSSSKGGIKMEGGVGILEFTAQAGSYDAEGNSKQTWEGRISVTKADGGDTTFTLKEDYIVAKPVIQVQSASVQALYLRCGNKLNIQVPALGVNYDPSFSATGAATERGSKKGEVIVVPNSANVALTVSSGGNTIGTENFKVRTVPKPSLAVAGLNLKQGGACPASLTVKAIADESFKAFLPEDARYRVTEVEVIHIRGRRPVGTKRGGGEININDFRANAREGDRLFIEVKKIQRMNYKGQVEDVAIATESGQFNYNITQ
jgi:gliding motility-associated protein GldM